MTSPSAFPLCWPTGVARTKVRERSPFKVPLDRAVADLQKHPAPVRERHRTRCLGPRDFFERLPRQRETSRHWRGHLFPVGRAAPRHRCRPVRLRRWERARHLHDPRGAADRASLWWLEPRSRDLLRFQRAAPASAGWSGRAVVGRSRGAVACLSRRDRAALPRPGAAAPSGFQRRLSSRHGEDQRGARRRRRARAS